MIELWGGAECTVNRVGDRYHDQTVLTGHDHRLGDLELFAELGLKALRYPVLWERVSPADPGDRDFAWADDRLAQIRRLGMRPIAGLVHHGSGPRWTSLLDDHGFALGLAAHAQAVAERYPWLDAYTPVNEPLTTARFSCLYGHWFPHAKDEGALWRAVLNQIDATRLAMARIRRVNTAAQLVQTEDLGHTHATPAMAEHAEHDNRRRWITWDLLCGRVGADHPLTDRIAAFGLGDRLKAIADDPCPPDVVGVNHYPTSERMLDDDVEAYPPELRPGPGEPRYVDVEAVRVSTDGVVGIEALLAQAWARYRIPVAVTECHNGCTRDEQIRWVVETWKACERLQRQGCDIRAVTAWSLLGAVDWNSLLTRTDGRYEPGVFDLRGRAPRRTALADVYAALAQGAEPQGIALGAPGWWRRDTRLTLGVRRRSPAARESVGRSAPAPLDVPPLLITGATGTLGRALVRACESRALACYATDRRLLRLGDVWRAGKVVRALRPAAVIHAAGWVRVDEAEDAPDACLQANVRGALILAEACALAEVPFVAFSSDLIFDGLKGSSYLEDDDPAPLSVYGRSKALMEAGIAAVGGRSLVVRTAAFFQERDAHNFAAQTLAALQAGTRVQAADDTRVTPTYVPDLADAVLDLVLDGEVGRWHLTSQGDGLSWAQFARLVAAQAGLDPARIDAVPGAALGWSARRPPDASLDSRRGRMLPSLESAISRFVAGWSRQAQEQDARSSRDGPAAAPARQDQPISWNRLLQPAREIGSASPRRRSSADNDVSTDSAPPQPVGTMRSSAAGR